MSRFVVLSMWKAHNPIRVLVVAIRNKKPTKPATVVDLTEYRNSLSEDSRWVRHYMWLADIRFKARQRRSAAKRMQHIHNSKPRR